MTKKLLEVIRSSSLKVSCKKVVLENYAKLTKQHLCPNPFFNKVEGSFIKKKPPSQVFSCKFFEILKNTYFATCERLLLNPRTYNTRSLENIAKNHHIYSESNVKILRTEYKLFGEQC